MQLLVERVHFDLIDRRLDAIKRPGIGQATHLAVTGAVDDKTVEWLERGSDDQYHAR